MADVAQPSRTLVGRDAELTEIASLLGVRSLSDASEPGSEGDRRHAVLSGDAGVGKTRLLMELRDLRRRRRLAGRRRALPRLRRQRAALPPVLRGARPARGRAARARRQVTYEHPALVPPAPGPPGHGAGRRRRRGRRRVRRQRRPRRPVHRRARAARGGRRARPAPRRRRGLPLGRPVDPRPAQLPVLPAVRAARSRWWPPTAPTTSTAGTRCAARSPSGPGCAASSGSSSARCPTTTSAPWSPCWRRPACSERELDDDRRPRRGQRVLRRGAGRRRRHVRRQPARWTSPTCSWSASTGSTTTPGRRCGSRASPAARSPTTCSPRPPASTAPSSRRRCARPSR